MIFIRDPTKHSDHFWGFWGMVSTSWIEADKLELMVDLYVREIIYLYPPFAFMIYADHAKNIAVAGWSIVH
jgi:hypothetical protein